MRDRSQPLLRRVSGRRCARPAGWGEAAVVVVVVVVVDVGGCGGGGGGVFHWRPSAAKARYPAKQWLTPIPQVPLSARARNGANADQGRMCLSRRRVRADPAFASTAAVPEGPRAAGSPFLSLVSFGEAKESDPPPGGPRPLLHASGKRTSQSPVRYRAGDLSKRTKPASQAMRDQAGDHRQCRAPSASAVRYRAGDHGKKHKARLAGKAIGLTRT